MKLAQDLKQRIAVQTAVVLSFSYVEADQLAWRWYGVKRMFCACSCFSILLEII